MQKSKDTKTDGSGCNYQSEGRIQQECFMWLWNKHPETRELLFMVHNNPRNKIDGARLKAMGMIAGVSDMLFLWNGTAYCFEFKTPIGVQSKAQKNWQTKVEKQGIQYFIIRNLPDFVCILNNIL